MRHALLACTLLALAPAAADAATRTFPVPAFDRVRSDVPFDVRIHTGAPFHVHAVGRDDMLARLRVGVRNGELAIGAEHGSWFRSFTWRKEDRILIDVTMPRLGALALDGPGNIAVDVVRSPSFSGSLSGPGNIQIGRIETSRADLAVSGPGTLTLAGRAGNAHIVGSGPGSVRGRDLTVAAVQVDLSGPGDVAVTALRSATVRLNGPGDVRIFGHPHCQVVKNGPGDVHCGG